MYEVCNGYKDLLIYDDSGLNNSWVVMTALRLYRDNNFKETFNKCATEYPNIAPSSLWFVELFDVALNMDGEFIRLTEEYLATKQIITVGGTFFGQW